ncbi:MAG: GNAT family N-acetyltransferase [Woeseia sp.]
MVLLVDATTREIKDDAILQGARDIVESSMMPPYVAQRILDVLDDPRAIEGVQPRRIPLAGNENIVMRAIRPDDAAREKRFLQCLSETGIAANFSWKHCDLQDTELASHVARDCSASEALVAVTENPARDRIVGITRLKQKDRGTTAEFVLATLDGWRAKGVSSQLLRGLIANAAVADIQKLEGWVAVDDAAMLEVARQLGFDIGNVDAETGQCSVSKILRQKKLAHYTLSDPEEQPDTASDRTSIWAGMYGTVIAAARRAWGKISATGSPKTNNR